MGAKVDITFNSKAFKEILMSDGVKNMLQDEADKIARKANGNLTDPAHEKGFEAKVVKSGRMSNHPHGGRWMGIVEAKDQATTADELENKVLSRSV